MVEGSGPHEHRTKVPVRTTEHAEQLSNHPGAPGPVTGNKGLEFVQKGLSPLNVS